MPSGARTTWLMNSTLQDIKYNYSRLGCAKSANIIGHVTLCLLRMRVLPCNPT